MSSDARSIRVGALPGVATAFVGFAGMQLELPIPNFAWGGVFSALPVQRVLVRDTYQFWYLRGLEGIAGDVAGSVSGLRTTLTELDTDRWVCIGASAGGFGTLLYGSLLGADEVHSFAPMSRMPSRTIPEVLRLARTRRWRLMRKNFGQRLRPGIDRGYYDLRAVLQADNGRTRYHIYYGRDNDIDSRHAEYLDGLPRVTLHPQPLSHHDVARYLRDTGELSNILAGAYERVSGATPVSA